MIKSVNSKSKGIVLFPDIRYVHNQYDNGIVDFSYSFFCRKKHKGKWYIQEFFRAIRFGRLEINKITKCGLEMDNLNNEVVESCLKPILKDVHDFLTSKTVLKKYTMYDGTEVNQLDENQEH